MVYIYDSRRFGPIGRQELAALASRIRCSLLIHGVDSSYVDHPMLERETNFYTMAAEHWIHGENAEPHVLSIPTFQYFLKSGAIRTLLADPRQVELIGRNIIVDQKNKYFALTAIYKLATDKLHFMLDQSSVIRTISFVEKYNSLRYHFIHEVKILS